MGRGEGGEEKGGVVAMRERERVREERGWGEQVGV